MKLTQENIRQWVSYMFRGNNKFLINKTNAMETLQITKDNALKAYNNGCDDVKAVLENLFGSENFKPKNITDRVKTFDDACKVLNIKPLDIIGHCKTTDESAYAKLKVIAQALNEGWKPDWANSREYKYYPWFDLSSGSGLRFDVYVNRISSSNVSSRLCFKSAELAKYAANQFLDIYTDFFIQ